MSKSDQLVWQAESVRLTVFTATQPALADLSGSWKSLVGDEPDAAQTKPKECVLQEFGPFREATLTFRYVPHRIDWQVHTSKPSLETWDTIGTFADETPPFVNLMKKWLAVSPKIKRMAFGAVLISPVSDHNEGYGKISKYLPFDVDLKARNFTYQINRPRKSRFDVSGLEINRLSKWACMERRTAQFVVGEAMPIGDDSSPLITARLEVDINTASDYPNSLDPGNLADLFSECVDLGAEIAEKGDIP